MTRVVITAAPPDNDAVYVSAALQLQGHTCDIWYASDYPMDARQTLGFSGSSSVAIDALIGGPSDWSYDTCWKRDIPAPVIDWSNIHPDDRAYVASIGQQYHVQHWSLLASPCLDAAPRFWVNSLEGSRRGESKPLQLHLAPKAGFTVPDTIISNHPADIRAFLRSHPGGVIRKSLYPHFWNEGDESVSNRTAPVREADLPSDEVLCLTPEIYQVEIKKVAEVRAVFIGKSAYALMIVPDEHKKGRFVDWRVYHRPGMATLEPVSLPSNVYESCLSMMQMLGIVTASFDLLVDKDGVYSFAEVNQRGCFLWMENRSLPVLQVFCQFLAEGNPDFVWSGAIRDDLSVRAVRKTSLFSKLFESQKFHRVPPRQVDNSSSGRSEER